MKNISLCVGVFIYPGEGNANMRADCPNVLSINRQFHNLSQVSSADGAEKRLNAPTGLDLPLSSQRAGRFNSQNRRMYGRVY